MSTANDPGRVILRRALRVAVVLPLTYALFAYVLQVGDAVAYAVFGVFALLGMCDFGGPNRDRAAAYLLTGLAGCVAIAIGSFAAYNVYVAIGVTFIIGATLSFATLLRGYVSTAVTGVLLPFVIAATSPANIAALPSRLYVFALATVICTAAALLLWPSHAHSVLRLRVADCLHAMANLTRAIWPADGDQPIDVAARQRELRAAAHQLRGAYEGRLLRPGKATSRDRALMRLVDEITRMRLFLRWRPRDETIYRAEERQLAEVAAQSLEQSSLAMRGQADPPNPEILDVAREQQRRSSDDWAFELLAANDPAAVEKFTDASFHLRTAALGAELVTAYTTGALGQETELEQPTTAGMPFHVPHVATVQILSTNLTWRSPWLQLALRTGLALMIAVGVVVISGVDHGFWVVLGTLSALRLDAVGTGRTAVQAIVGTVGGFIIGSLLVIVVSDVSWVYWILLPVAAFLSAYTPSLVSIPVGQASFTIFVIVFYGILAGPTLQTGEVRVLDIAIGLTISLLVSALLWPRGIRTRVAESLQTAMHAASAAFVASYDRLTNGPASDAALDAAAQHAMRSVGIANETFDVAIAQTGASADLGDSWSFVANSAGHIIGCASLVAFLARTVTKIDDGPVKDSMLACAHSAAARLNQSVDALEADFSNVRTNSEYEDEQFLQLVLADARGLTLGDDFERLNANVRTALADLVPRAQAGDTTVGYQSVGIVYARDWLLHAGWLAKRLEEVTRTPTK